MHKDSLIYSPDFIYKENPTWFHKFIMLQDEVPSNLLKVKDNPAFIKERIIQEKVRPVIINRKSIFSSDTLHIKSFEVKEKQVQYIGWLSITVLLCYILFAYAQYNYFKRIQQIFKAFFANRFFNQLSRDAGLFSERASLFLFSSYLIGLSLYIYNTYVFYFRTDHNNLQDVLFFIKILAGIFILYLLKFGLFNLSGIIFKVQKETSDYILNIFIYGQLTGVVLLPLIVLISYIHTEIIIYFGAILIILLYIYRIFRGFSYAIYSSKISVYYLFLYLCTLEILPFFVLYKIFSTLNNTSN